MTPKIFFLHSAGAQHDEEGSARLIKYIKENLSASYQVIAPIMPDPGNPQYEQWKEALTGLFPIVDEETILIGHSLGGSVLLKFLSEQKPLKKIKALYLVAVPFWGLEGWEVDEYLLAENFADHLPASSAVGIYQSDDDEIVSPDHAERYAVEIAGSKYHLLNGHGHVFWDGLPELVEDIRKLQSEGQK